MKLTENILHRVQNLLLIADRDGNIEYVSPSVEPLLGYNPQELLGDGWWSLKRGSPEDRIREMEYISKCAVGKVPVHEGSYINKIYTREGIPKWIIWTDSLLENSRLLGVGIDYSQNRKENLTHEVIFNISEKANQTDDLDALFRYMAEEIIRIFETKNIYILLYDETKENVKFPIYIDEEFPEGRKLEGSRSKIRGGLTDYTIQQKAPRLFTRSLIDKMRTNGEFNPIGEIPAVWMGLPLKFGEKIFGLIALQDYDIENFFNEKDLELMKFISREIASILERKQQEEELRQREEQYRVLTESLFEGICIHDFKRVISANQAFCKMFGIDQEEVVGYSVKSFLDPDYHALFELGSDLKAGVPREVVGLKKDGSKFWIEILGRDQKLEGVPVRLTAIRNIDARKREEKAKEEAEREARIKAMFQNSTEVIALLNAEGRFTFESSSVKRILGYGESEREGKLFTSYVHPEDLERVREVFNRALHNPGKSFKVEFSYRKKLGKWRTFLSVFKNLLSDKLVEGVLVSSVDITERKKAEQKIRENEERMRTMVQHSIESIVLIDIENHLFTEVNPEAEKMFGYNRRELLSMGPLDLSPRIQENNMPSHQAVEEIMRTVRENGSLTYEWSHLNKAGEVFSCEIRMVMLPSYTTPIARASIVDITERKHREKERIAKEKEVRLQKEVLLKISQSKPLISGNLDESLSEIIQSSGITLNVSRVSVWFFDDSRKKLICQKSYETNGTRHIEGEEVEINRSAKYLSALEKERILFSGNGYKKNGGRALHLPGQLAYSAMDSPIRVGGKMVGILSIEDKDEAKHWSQEEQNFATSMADLVALSVEAWERTKAEKSLLESEIRFKTLFDRSPDAIFVEDEFGNILDVNEAACKLHETTREELVGKNVADMVPLEYRQAVLNSLPKWFSGEVSYAEGYSVTRSGRKIPVEIHSGKIAYKGKTAIILQVRDITRRKEEEAKLVESQEKLRRQNQTLLDLAHERPTSKGDLQGAFREITRAACEAIQADRTSIWFFNEERSAIICRCEYVRSSRKFNSGAEIYVANHREYFEAIESERFVTASDTRESDLTRPFFKGSYTGRATALVHAPIRSGGDILGMVSFEQNDLPRVWTTEELSFAGSMADLVALSLEEWKKHRAEQELLQRNFELDNFVYRASHDLKAPLNSIMGLIGLIEAENPPATVIQYIKLMNRSILKLESFILDLADYSRNARMEISSERIRFQEMVEESVRDLHYMENSERTRIEIKVKQKVDFFSDPVRLSIILNNFISNAIKYQDLRKEEGYVRISVDVNAKRAQIQVADNGLGIEKEYQDKIFNMFFRASVQAQGTGLGLYIVKDAIEKLKGSIEVESEPGVGSTFTLTLPNLDLNNSTRKSL